MEQSYKEKYEQALSKAKDMLNYKEVRREDMEYLFPELAESEDKKIRKELISFFSDLPDTDTFRGIPPSKVIAWLEKQKEYESTDFEYVWDRTDCGELTAALDKYSEEAIINMCHAWYDKGIELERKSWLEKQGQVKESTISQHENKMCKENGNSLTCEDEKVRREIINYFQYQSEEEPTRKEIHNKWIAWLENIPYTIDHEKREGFHLGYKACLEKQGEQKFEMKTAEESLGIDSATYNKIVDECIFGEQKPEENKGNIGGISSNWSEEDEEHIDSLLKRLDALCRNKFERTRFAISEDRDWLKSLRHQNRWKPSDEQISLLQAIINEPKNAASESCQIVLKDILEQLKKLKEVKL